MCWWDVKPEFTSLARIELSFTSRLLLSEYGPIQYKLHSLIVLFITQQVQLACPPLCSKRMFKSNNNVFMSRYEPV